MIRLILDVASVMGYHEIAESPVDSIRAYKAPPLPLNLVDSLLIAEPRLTKFQDPVGCATSLLVMEARTGIKPEDVMRIMELETASTFDYKIKCPTSNARGLFQHIPSTAKSVAAKLNLPDLSTQWRQIRAAEYMFQQRQIRCSKIRPGYQIKKDRAQLYLAILYPNAPCGCKDSDVILRGKVAEGNPYFHVDKHNDITYLKEIAYKLNEK